MGLHYAVIYYIHLYIDELPLSSHICSRTLGSTTLMLLTHIRILRYLINITLDSTKKPNGMTHILPKSTLIAFTQDDMQANSAAEMLVSDQTC